MIPLESGIGAPGTAYGRNKAIVAIARKMLVAVWFLLHEASG